jgi:sugar phosphate isomerase/epimerase
LQAESPAALVERVLATGVRRVQLALDPLRERPEIWGTTQDQFAAAGLSIVSGMFGTVGEDYTTLDTIRETGGVVPDATWDANWRAIQATADLASRMGLNMVSFHAGFLPHEETDPAYAKLAGRLRQIANVFASKSIQLGLETGQETADTLDAFLAKLGCPNVGVNFDPANMLLYDKGDPIVSLRRLGRWLKQVHIKDAVKTKVPGTWGEEVVAGTGQVDWKAFFATLKELGYTGPLCIEREAGNSRIDDIQAGAKYVSSLAV